jgi:glutamate racemase
MHLLITDSGVGGLSVCAHAERFLRTCGFDDSVKLTYVNASPENDFGYNAMGSRQEKLEYFDRFLGIILDTYDPDSIYIACNTLSVLYPDTTFSKGVGIPVRGIVETGVDRLLRELRRSPQSVAAIFGTVTTIEEMTYPKLLRENEIDAARIVSQSCPSLADTISEDRSGEKAREKIDGYVAAAIATAEVSADHYLTYLACTHYGYRKDYFTAAFEKCGLDTRVLNPNEFVVEELFKKAEKRDTDIAEKTDIEVEFITRYRIPETALETISFFLEKISPKTVAAFTGYTHAPDLF